jgi:hypothetical protein
MHLHRKRVLSSPRLLSLVTVAAGLAGAVLSLSLTNPYVVTLGPLVGVGGALGYVHRNRTPSVARFALSAWTATSLYVLLFGGVLAAYLVAGYQRTLLVHVGLVALHATVLLGVLSVESTEGGRFLPLVLLTGLLHRGMVYYASAVQLGIDAQFHVRLARQIAEQGSLGPLAVVSSKYWYAPLFHVLTGGTSEMLGVNVRDAAFTVVTLPTAIVPVLAVYGLIRWYWSARVATVGSLLYVVSDQAIAKSVHTATTSVGVVFFAFLLFVTVRYLDRGGVNHLVAFYLILLGLNLTHQLSLPITTVGLTAYVGMRTLWEGRLDGRSLLVVVLLWSTNLVQASVTKINGPRGQLTILNYLRLNAVRTYRQLQRTGGGRDFYGLPPGAEFTVNSSEALSSLHTLGIAILFCLGVMGATLWLNHRTDDATRVGLSLGTIVAVMSGVVFSLPIVGVNLLLPARWFPFMYVPLSVLAAPAVTTLGTVVYRNRRSAVGLLVALSLFTPYGAFMAWNYPGAYDGPVFDDSPKAYRLTTTDTEAASYRHAMNHDGDATVVLTRRGYLTIRRGADDQAAVYGYDLNESRLAFSRPALLADWEYAHTNHGTYLVGYRGRSISVYGPLPVDRPTLESRYSVVYAAGSDRLLYAPELNESARGE